MGDGLLATGRTGGGVGADDRVINELLDRADEVAEAAARDDAVREATARCFVDGFATVVLGLGAPVVAGLRADLGEAAAGRGVAVLGSDRPVPAGEAALLHGTAAHVFDIGDGLADAGLHPGEVLVPVAMAVGEREGRSPADLCRSLAGGYEVVGRVGRAVHPQLTERGVCPSGPAGAMGAAYVAGRLMGLSRSETVGAIGTALLSAPISTFEWAASRPLHAGWAAMAGVRAADLARRALAGGIGVLDGSRGLAALAGVPPTVLAARALADLDPAVARTYFKPYAACRHSHGAIDAAIGLRDQLPDQPVATVGRVEVTTYPLAALLVDRTTTVDSGWAACDTSIQYATATALLTGDCGPDAMARRGRRSAAAHQLAARVSVRASPEFGAAYPDEATTQVVITLDGGGTREATVRVRLGDPGRPLSTDRIRDRFAGWAVRAGLPGAQAGELASRALEIGRGQGRTGALTAALAAVTGALGAADPGALDYP